MATVVKRKIVIRAMELADVDDVVRVEHSAYDFPWTRGIFEDCLRVGYICRLLEHGGVVSGHIIISAVAGEAHLLNLCVAPEMQGYGLGRRMLSHAMMAARVAVAHRMILEVRPSNWRALRLYQSAGFEIVGRRRGYYPAHEGREDALVMARDLHRRSAGDNDTSHDARRDAEDEG